jgi:AcrR family transcriptional regulator
MEDIAEKAELSKGTLYLYFNSKDDLHMAVARKAMLLLREATNAAVEKGGNALEILSRIGWAVVDFSETNPDHLRAIMALEDIRPEGVTMSRQDVQNMIFAETTVGTVLEIVKQGIDEGLIRDDLNPVLIAHTLWMSVFSVLRFVGIKGNLLEILEMGRREIYESQFEMVFNGIRK